MQEIRITGIIPALPTPVTAEGAVDDAALAQLVEFLIAGGAQGILPLGGTGEYTALTPRARRRVAEICVGAVGGRIPVVVGVLSPGLGDAIEAAQAFEQAGADALMVIAPYYVRPSQDGIRHYFRLLRREVGIPILLYDNPHRTHLVVEPATIAAMAADGSIAGMKASYMDLDHFAGVAQRVGTGFGLLSGQDTLFTEQVTLGAIGGMLGSAVLMPAYWREVQELAQAGRMSEALAAQRRLSPFIDALYAEENPGLVRAALAGIGLPVGGNLPPLGAVSPAALARLDEVMAGLRADGLLCR